MPPQAALEAAPIDNEIVGYGIISQPQPQLIKENEAPAGQVLYASPPVFHVDGADTKASHSLPVSSKPTAALVSPPTSLADEMDTVQDGEALASVENDTFTALYTPNSSSRHSSRQPRHVERFVTDMAAIRASKPIGQPASSTVNRTTPGPPSSKKPSSRPSSSHAKKSAPMVDKHFGRYAATSLSPHQAKHVKHQIDEENTDAESLRLIRELQEEEFGLRKRSTRG